MKPHIIIEGEGEDDKGVMGGSEESWGKGWGRGGDNPEAEINL